MNKMKKMFVGALLAGFAIGANAEGDNVVTATYGNATGNTTRTMTLALNHETDYVSFILQLTLPQGTIVTGVKSKSPLISNETIDLSAVGGSATESKSFIVSYRQVSPTKCNIIGYNYANDKIGGKSGDILLTVTLQTEEGIAYDANAITTACTFVDVNSTEANLGSPVSEARLWGDVVKDGKLATNDYQAIANMLANASNVGVNLDEFAADVNQNDKIGTDDYQFVANKLAGK